MKTLLLVGMTSFMLSCVKKETPVSDENTATRKRHPIESMLSDSCKQIIASDSFYFIKPRLKQAQYDAIFKVENFPTEITDSQIQTIDFDCAIAVNRTNEQISELRKILGEDLDKTLSIEAIHTKGAKCIIESRGMRFLEAKGQFIRFTTKDHAWNLDLRKPNFPVWVFILYKKGKNPLVFPAEMLTKEEIERYFE